VYDCITCRREGDMISSNVIIMKAVKGFKYLATNTQTNRTRQEDVTENLKCMETSLSLRISFGNKN
jgi:hypothetical protein